MGFFWWKLALAIVAAVILLITLLQKFKFA
jgi:hypothetical protein